MEVPGGKHSFVCDKNYCLVNKSYQSHNTKSNSSNCANLVHCRQGILFCSLWLVFHWSSLNGISATSENPEGFLNLRRSHCITNSNIIPAIIPQMHVINGTYHFEPVMMLSAFDSFSVKKINVTENKWIQ